MTTLAARNTLVDLVAGLTAARGEPTSVRLQLAHSLSDEEFAELCLRYPEARIEQTSEGELIVMPPAGGETGNRNFGLIARLAPWVVQDGTGRGFDSSTGFILPNGAKLSPDVAWVTLSRLAVLTPPQKQGFLPLCPDFVIELRSPSDRLTELQAKMDEYITNGTRLGWLIDPTRLRVYVYRPGQAAPEELDAPASLSGDPELPGLTLDLAEIWEPGF